MERTVPGIAGTLPDVFVKMITVYGSDRLSPFSHISAFGLS